MRVPASGVPADTFYRMAVRTANSGKRPCWTLPRRTERTRPAPGGGNPCRGSIPATGMRGHSRGMRGHARAAPRPAAGSAPTLPGGRAPSWRSICTRSRHGGLRARNWPGPTGSGSGRSSSSRPAAWSSVAARSSLSGAKQAPRNCRRRSSTWLPDPSHPAEAGPPPIVAPPPANATPNADGVRNGLPDLHKPSVAQPSARRERRADRGSQQCEPRCTCPVKTGRKMLSISTHNDKK